jgi:hypothetical protein
VCFARLTVPQQQVSEKSGIDCAQNVAKISVVPTHGIIGQGQFFFSRRFVHNLATISHQQVVAEECVEGKTKSGVL